MRDRNVFFGIRVMLQRKNEFVKFVCQFTEQRAVVELILNEDEQDDVRGPRIGAGSLAEESTEYLAKVSLN